jgi:SsrA-binding protein
MVLEGWEVKAIRAGQVQLTDGYVHIRDGELFLIGCRINALRSASTHVHPEADRTKKLLMHKEEIRRLVGKVEQKGFTLVPLNLHYKGGRVKAEIALAKGKASTTSATPRRSATGSAKRPPDAAQGLGPKT